MDSEKEHAYSTTAKTATEVQNAHLENNDGIQEEFDALISDSEATASSVSTSLVLQSSSESIIKSNPFVDETEVDRKGSSGLKGESTNRTYL